MRLNTALVALASLTLQSSLAVASAIPIERDAEVAAERASHNQHGCWHLWSKERSTTRRLHAHQHGLYLLLGSIFMAFE